MRKCKNFEICGNKIEQRTECSACRQRKWRKKHPFKYHWKNQRNRAQQRGWEYTITLEQFKELWLEHPEKWKCKKDSSRVCNYDLHRIDDTKGYHIDNVEILSKEEHNEIHYGSNDEPIITETQAPF